jgi:hypothetical protein
MGIGCSSIIFWLADLFTDQIGIVWFAVPLGVGICILSIRSILRGEWKQNQYTGEDLARAKKELDRMYFAEHGVWPKEQGSLLREIDPKEDAQE